jgi:hypothetical protein
MRKQVFQRVLLLLLGPFSFLSAAFTQIKTIIGIITGNKISIFSIVSVMTKDEKLSIAIPTYEITSTGSSSYPRLPGHNDRHRLGAA